MINKSKPKPLNFFFLNFPILAVLLMFNFHSFSLTADRETSPNSVDKEYTRLIKEATTMPEFLSPLISYLPKAEKIPSPMDVLGYIAGAPGKLTYNEDIVEYMTLLAEASPNVKVFSIGESQEGREMVIVAVTNAETLKEIQKYKNLSAKLADPRIVKTEKEADAIISQAKPIYWLTSNLHSVESGSAEASMELAYRLAVDNHPYIQEIRENMIVLITPCLEPDGHDRHTDWFYKYNQDITEYKNISRVPYWGNYIYHDNNRDMIAISQLEMQNGANAYFDWHPVVIQDNHESIAFLWISPGRGPYTPLYFPSLTSECNLLTWWEVTQLTSYGMPGVWTRGFWGGWSPNAWSAISSNHHGIMRFYETFGHGTAKTVERDLSHDSRQVTELGWSKPLPAYKKVLWSLRNNINYQISGDLLAFYFVATHKEFFLKNFWKRGMESLKKSCHEPLFAWIVPANQKDPVDTAYLINILLKQRIEVHRATAPIKVNEGNFPSGSYMIRMDQPYGDFAKILLEKQKYPEDAPLPYDDTGWTLGLHMGVETIKINDKAIFDVPAVSVLFPVKANGSVSGDKEPTAYIIKNNTVNNLIPARLKLKDFKVLAAETPFSTEKRSFDAGSLIIPVPSDSPSFHKLIKSTATDFGLEIVGCKQIPNVKTHELDIPSVAIYHTWYSTQDDGWVRFAFDQLDIPFSMINKDHIRTENLKDNYDVILFSNCRGNKGSDIVNGLDPSLRGPLAYVKSSEFKYLGSPDSSENITGGMGIEGMRKLQEFVRQGGLLILLHNPVRIAVDYGIVRGINILNTSEQFYNPGSLLKGEVANPMHPISYGYDKEIPIFRSHAGPLLDLSEEMDKYVVARYADEEKICLSGIIKSPQEIKGKAAIIDVPLGEGHIVLFTFNPFWRDLSHSSYMFVFNAILHHNDLDTGFKE